MTIHGNTLSVFRTQSPSSWQKSVRGMQFIRASHSNKATTLRSVGSKQRQRKGSRSRLQ